MEVEDPGDSVWTGRRVVEMKTLAENLKACQLCSQPLHLSNCIGESRSGLGGYLQVRCAYVGCRVLNHVHYGTKHNVLGGASKAWDINTKVAAGENLLGFDHGLQCYNTV